MVAFVEQYPESIHLGFEDSQTLYLREGYFSDKTFITPSHLQYTRLVGLLGEEPSKTFVQMDVEYNYLKDILVDLIEEDIEI